MIDSEKPNPVIRLGAYRRYSELAKKFQILYLTSRGHSALSPTELARVSITADDLNSFTTLKTRAQLNPPDVILVDSDIAWANLTELISFMHTNWEVPILLLCGENESPKLIKEAYGAGISDTLVFPFPEEDVFHSIEVLLKLHGKRQIE